MAEPYKKSEMHFKEGSLPVKHFHSLDEANEYRADSKKKSTKFNASRFTGRKPKEAKGAKELREHLKD